MKYELIVLIDDNENTLFVNEDVVSDYYVGSTVKSFNHPKKFLSEFRNLQSQYERKWLMVLDLNMPEYSGYKLLDHLEENDYNLETIDIIILTSSHQKLDIEKSEIYINIIAYIEKPLSSDKLKSHYLFE
jgi:FixJ family two-component response regulator